MKLISIFLTVQLLVAGCSSGHKQGEEGLTGVQSLLWFQYSAEVEALFLQGYNIASEHVMNYDFSESERLPAVTLDLDETVLDNSPFNVQMLREGFSYSLLLKGMVMHRTPPPPLDNSLPSMVRTYLS